MDLTGYASPESQFSALYKISDDARQDRHYREQQAYQRQQAQLGRQDANDKYFTNLLNPKDYLTGTHWDQNTVQLLGEATRQAYELSAKGASMNDITMAIGPLVGKVADYTSKAKMYQTAKKEVLEKFKGVKGYDMDALARLLDEETFYRRNPVTGALELNVDGADPSLRTPLERILKGRLHEVTTNEGLMDWAGKMPTEEFDDNVLATDAKGNRTRTALRTKRASWEVAESDGKGGYRFVPRHEEATDGGAPLQHDFQNPDGTITRAPVRLLDRGTFQNLLASQPGAADYIKGQVLKHIAEYKDENGNPIDLSHPKADLVARAVAYDYLKPFTRGIVSARREQTLSPQQVRINFTGSPYAPQGGSSSGSGGDVAINDAYARVGSRVQQDKSRGYTYTRFNALSAQDQKTIIKYVKEFGGEAGSLASQSNLYLTEGDGGKIVVRMMTGTQPDLEKDPAPFELDPLSMNLPVQVNTKAKAATVQQNNSSTPAAPAPRRKPLNAFIKK